MNRRSFIRGLLSAAVVGSAAVKAVIGEAPKQLGDGEPDHWRRRLFAGLRESAANTGGHDLSLDEFDRAVEEMKRADNWPQRFVFFDEEKRAPWDQIAKAVSGCKP